MAFGELGVKLLNRVKYGCDLDSYSYLKNGMLQWSNNPHKRINLMVSTIDRTKMYGGLTTAFNFFEALEKQCQDFDVRIIVTNVEVNSNVADAYQGFEVVSEGDFSSRFQIFDYTIKNSSRPSLTVRENDIFLCTFWTTMYLAREIRDAQKEKYGRFNPIIYLIQDYEPGFYKWSSDYLLAESTYKAEKTIAVINSINLMEYMKSFHYTFFQTYYFQPKLNRELKEVLLSSREVERSNRVIIYGRPFNGRNCFSLIVAALNDAIEKDEDLKEWEFCSIGAKHKNIRLARNAVLINKGKLSIKEYGNMLLRSKVGISMMCSPHPSYPPLEMATFGVKTITNAFLSKDLSLFSSNIISVEEPTVSQLSDAIIESCKGPLGRIDYEAGYINDDDQFGEIIMHIRDLL